MKTKQNKKDNLEYSVYYTIFKTKKGSYIYFGSGDRYEPTRRTWQFNHNILGNKKIESLKDDFWGVQTERVFNVKTKKYAEGVEYALIGIFGGTDKLLNMNYTTKKHRGRNTKRIREAVEAFIEIMVAGAPIHEDLKIVQDLFFESQENILSRIEK